MLKEYMDYANYIADVDKRIADKRTELEATTKAIEDIKNLNKAIIKNNIFGIKVNKSVDFKDIPKLDQKKIILNYEIEALEEMKTGQEARELAEKLAHANRKEVLEINQEAMKLREEADELQKKVWELKNQAVDTEAKAGIVAAENSTLVYELAKKQFGEERVENLYLKGFAGGIVDLFIE